MAATRFGQAEGVRADENRCAGKADDGTGQRHRIGDALQVRRREGVLGGAGGDGNARVEAQGRADIRQDPAVPHGSIVPWRRSPLERAAILGALFPHRVKCIKRRPQARLHSRAPPV